jgi:DNA repair photolyase
MSTLVGIARLAASGPVLEAKRSVEYRQLPTRKLLNRCDNPRVPFRWTINPYRGCEYGCKYCYARYTHGFMELREAEDFENRIFAKAITASGLRSELAKVPLGDGIGLGTATDPYQPAERRYQITRRVLRALADTSGQRLFVTTKSDLIVRDVGLLREVHERHWLRIGMTVTTLDAGLARAMEPKAPRPGLRLEAVRKLAAAGLRVGVQCSPVLPLINERELPALARAAAEAGACSFVGHAVFLRAEALSVFMPFLAGRFPQLVSKYLQRFGRGAHLPGEYTERLSEKIRQAREAAGLTERDRGEDWRPMGPQLALEF